MIPTKKYCAAECFVSCGLIMIVLILAFDNLSLQDAKAEVQDSHNIKILNLSSSPSELTAGKWSNITAIVENNRNADVNLTKIKLVSFLDISKDLNMTLKPHSSQAAELSLKLPQNTTSGTYILIVSISDSLGDVVTSSTNLVVKSNVIDFSSVVSLLAAYYIPAQSIERIMEYFSILPGRLNKRKEMFLLQTTIDSLKKIRDQVVSKICKSDKTEKSDVIKTKQNTDSKVKKSETITETITETTSLEVTGQIAKNDESGTEFYKKFIREIDEQISDNSTKHDEAKTNFAFRMWLHGLWLAFLPGFLFAYFGLGILTMSGYGEPWSLIYDTFLNTIFIGSGTKPIHDAIDAIMNIKK